jgi:hypothetical protein
MKRLLSVLLAVLMPGLLALGSAVKAPSIAFDSTSRDFGTVTEGESLKQVFTFRNKGDATLEILKVEPS